MILEKRCLRNQKMFMIVEKIPVLKKMSMYYLKMSKKNVCEFHKLFPKFRKNYHFKNYSLIQNKFMNSKYFMNFKNYSS